MFSNSSLHKIYNWAYFHRIASKLSHLPDFLEAMLLLFLVNVGLARLRYPLLLHLLESSARKLRNTAATPESSKEQVISALRRARRYGMRKASCLEEALSIQWMLRRRNVETQLQIGVRRTNDNQLLGHAWVEDLGKVVSTDLQSPASFVVLTPVAGTPVSKG